MWLSTIGMAIAIFLNADFQLAAVGQSHALAQAAFAAKAVEHPRNGARVLAEFGDSRLKRSISSMTSMGIRT